MLLDKTIDIYLENHTTDESQLLYELNRETHLKTFYPNMLSGKVQGKFLEMVVRMIQPRNILEIGTFTGYSALSMAQALPEDGMLTTLESNEEIVAFARRFFDQSPYKGKIRLLEGNAKELIPTLDERFDLVFIDADKEQYVDYYELVLPLVKRGGFILADNVLWGGKAVHTDKNPDKETVGIRLFNDHVAADPRVEQVMLSVRDGLLLMCKVSDSRN
ncbi:MAG: class I SAM-dependent methyltransferase [Bacteroidales bacterium]|nr:class I SAM-dependent methyltransferase [Bacteroidales bacterium]